MEKKKSIYKILFAAQNQVYEIYCRIVSQSNLFGFISVEDLVFGKENSIVVDPSVEKLRNEFSGVKSFLVPMHSILRIDIVEKEGVGKILELNKAKREVV